MAAKRRQDHYEVLGVNHDAPDEVIRAAYRALAAKYHPDRNPGDAGAELRLKRLNAAFHVLGNADKRRQYDELTRSPEAGAGSNDDADVNRRPSPSNEQGPPRDPAPPQGNGSAQNKGIFAKILKVAGYLFLAFVMVMGGVIWYLKNQEDESRAEQATVTVEANYDPTACAQDTPVHVVITNGSKRSLKSVTFALRAFESGRSDDLAIDSGYLESTAIVRPGETSKTCWKVPSLKRNTSVFFRAEKHQYGATFYDASEFVPRTEAPRDPVRSTADPTGATPQSSAEFNLGEARSRLAAIANGVQTCKRGEASGGGKVELVFSPSGAVQSATLVAGSPFDGSPTGKCVEERFRQAHISPFSGGPVPVTKSFSIN